MILLFAIGTVVSKAAILRRLEHMQILRRLDMHREVVRPDQVSIKWHPCAQVATILYDYKSKSQTFKPVSRVHSWDTAPDDSLWKA